MDRDYYEATMKLRQFMFNRVYLDKIVKAEDEKLIDFWKIYIVFIKKI